MSLSKSLIKTEITKQSGNDEFSTPLDISDIISICKDFSALGWHIQKQIEAILSFGIDEAINKNIVEVDALNHIKFFLKQVNGNCYFGDAATQAEDCLNVIKDYEERHKLADTKYN